MRTHVQRTAAGGFDALRKLRSIRRSVPTSVYQTLTVLLIVSRLDYGNATLVGIPANLSRHIQSVINAVACSVAGIRRSDHITNTLASFHWLRVPERVQFKLPTLIYKSLHSIAPQYLVDDLRYVNDIPGRRRLRSASSFQLEIPRTRLVTVGDRTFSAAGSRPWNSLPRDVTESQTLNVFNRKLKHFLFSLSFPGQ